MMKKGLMILSLCLLLVVSVCGCGQNNTAGGSASAQPVNTALVGTWTQVTEDGSPALPDVGIPSGYVFKENGDGEDLFWNMEFTYTATEDTIHISYKDSLGEDTDYKYSIEGETLTMTRKGDSDAIPMLYRQKTEDEKKAADEQNVTDKKKAAAEKAAAKKAAAKKAAAKKAAAKKAAAKKAAAAKKKAEAEKKAAEEKAADEE